LDKKSFKTCCKTLQHIEIENAVIDNGFIALLEKKILNYLRTLKLTNCSLKGFGAFCVMANKDLNNVDTVELIDSDVKSEDISDIMMLIEISNIFKLRLNNSE
jgi:hypothetical protein